MRGNANRTGRAPTPGKVRVIAGRFRNSKLEVADLAGLRPTPERVRETLFNWLQPVIAGARALDLYAGTGALGIEAASRGARAVTFVERDPQLARAIAGNLARLGVEGARVANVDATSFLAGEPSPHDVAFVDPPFDAKLWESTLAALARGWLADGAYVYVESPRGVLPTVPASFALHREGAAGEVRYALYRHGAT